MIITGIIFLWAAALARAQDSVPQGGVLSFRQALRQIAEKGRAVRIAGGTEEMIRGDAVRARSALLPQVSAQAGRRYYAYQPTAVTGATRLPTSERDFNVVGVAVYQTLYDFGGNVKNLDAAREQEGAARAATSRVRNEALLDLVNAYFDLLEIDRLVAVAVEEMVSLGGHLKDVVVLYREGVVTRNEFLTARVKFAGARQKLMALKNQRKVARAQLGAMLSLKDGVFLSVEDPEVHPDRDLTLAAAQARALAGRKEFREAARALKASELRQGSLRASERPSVFASGGYDYAANRYQARNDNWSGQVGIKLSVFNGGLTKGEIDKECARHAQLEEQQGKLEEDIRVQVERAFWGVHSAAENGRLARTAALQARENYRVNRVRYKEGQATSTEVLDAITLLTGVETDQWRAVYGEKRAWAALLYAMGTDISEGYLKEADHEAR